MVRFWESLLAAVMSEDVMLRKLERVNAEIVKRSFCADR